MLVNKNLLGLYNGVSQQPASIRLDSQCEIQENAMSSLVDGLYKRPPTELIASLNSVASANAGFHTIIRDENEKYFVVFTGNASDPIEVFDMEGNKKTVLYGNYLDDIEFFIDEPTVKDYLVCTSPKKDLRATTVADYTIITNKTITCEMLTTVGGVDQIEDHVTYEAMVYVRNMIQNIGYNVTVGTTTVTKGSGAHTKTDWMAEELYDLLVDELSSTYDFILKGSCIHIAKKDGTDFKFSVSDGWGDMAMYGFKGSAQSMTDLPSQGFEDFVCEIRGESVNSYDNYYVKYTNDADYQTGVWKECAKQGLYNIMNPDTLPHRLIRLSTGDFAFCEIHYTNRTVGDDVSASEPSFIGKTINDVFFHKNRLCFLAGENVIMSKSGEFWQFFPSTVMDVLDDDPIDVAASSNQVTILHHAVPFDKDVVLLSQLQQFILHAGTSGGLTPSNAACDATTAFNTSPNCSPVASGANLYFVAPQGSHTAIREYYVNSESLSNDAADVTAHCPNYLPDDIYKLAACPALDMLFALSGTEPRSIYVYKYYWNGNEKAQSSWSKWTFHVDIINIGIVDNYLYIVTHDVNGVHIERINLKKTPTGMCPFTIHLDRMKFVEGTYNPVTDRTEYLIGEYYTGSTFNVVNAETGSLVTEEPISGVIPVITDGVLELAGNHEGVTYCIGIPYTMRYQFSEWFMKAQENSANLSGVLKMRKVDLGYVDTGYIKVSVTPFNRETLVHEFTAHTIGVTEIGIPDILTGTKSFLLLCNAKGSIVEISNDTYLPSEIHAANFEGFYTTRSRLV